MVKITKKYTKLPNKLIDKVLLAPREVLNDSEKRILLYVARKTIGFHKEWDQISLTQFENKLSLSRPTISKTLKRLVKVGLLVKVQKGALNANHWKIPLPDLEKKLVKYTQLVKHTQLVKYDKEKLVKHTLPTKDSITKESNSNVKAFVKSFIEIKQYSFETDEMERAFWNRHAKPAKNLEVYPADEVLLTMAFLEVKGFPKKWTLETVAKYIDEVRKNKKKISRNHKVKKVLKRCQNEGA